MQRLKSLEMKEDKVEEKIMGQRNVEVSRVRIDDLREEKLGKMLIKRHKKTLLCLPQKEIA